MKYILDNDPEPLCLTFSTNKELLGEVCLPIYFPATIEEFLQVEEVDLKPDGRNIEVTEENKMEYIQYVTGCVHGGCQHITVVQVDDQVEV